MVNPVLAVAGASIGGGILQSAAQRRAAAAASGAQIEATEMQIAEQRRQYNEYRRLARPFVQTGRQGLRRFENLVGLNGFAAQNRAVNRLESNPRFQSLVEQGENALLQNASATGGLRGGNTQAALAQFRPQMLQAEIDRQLGYLGGLAGMGQNAIAGVGDAGTNTANQIGGALAQRGQAIAGNATAQGAATANMWGGITGTIGNVMGMVEPPANASVFGRWGF